MIERVISGGQSGADQAAWRAAKAAGIATGGWMPRDFLTEAGPRPEFAGMYGAREHESRQYPPRTRANVIEAQATLWFGHATSRGGQVTLCACVDAGRPSLIVDRDGIWTPQMTVTWLVQEKPKALNVAGNRESSAPGIGAWVEAYLSEVFRLLREAP